MTRTRVGIFLAAPMKNLLKDNKTVSAIAPNLAGIGANYGYRFDGDYVYLNAMFAVKDVAAHDCSWALQLWCCPTSPKSAVEITGHVVAQLPLPPIGEVADESESFEVSGLGVLPAGQNAHIMVMALVAGRGGNFNNVQDFVVLPNQEQFCLPRFSSNVGYRLDGARVVVEAQGIENPREASNFSGTLALELWALTAPYAGGSFQGTPLAGVAFDALAGQCYYANQAFDLPFTPPPAGSWNLVLMLREWTALGFVTRDYVNFAQPFTVQEEASEKPAPVAASVTEKTEEKASDSRVSINKASKSELASVKGMPTKAVDVIVAKRPFGSVEELVGVKGIGAKLLAKLRAKLKV